MRPHMSRDDFANEAKGYIEMVGDLLLGHACLRHLTDAYHVRLSQFRVGIGRTYHRITALLDHVLNIVLDRTKKQVRGIAAWRIIAMMANDLIGRDGTMREDIGGPMHADVLTLQLESSIAARISVALPLPTVIRAVLLYSPPKPLFRGRMLALGGIVAVDETLWLSFDIAQRGIVIWRNGRKLSTTAMAVTVGNIIRGMMGLHIEPPFDVLSPGTLVASPGRLYWDYRCNCTTGSICSQDAC